MTEPAPQQPSRPSRSAGPGPAARVAAPAGGAGAEPGPLAGLRQLTDRLLVVDVFVVLAGALWFVVAVVLHSQGVEAPLLGFQRLWEPLFTPAIGVLMAGALLSGALGWWQRRRQS